ncbi:MAG: chorismate synthase [Oscillospiraceae bacterium]|jgi:chorismate synthase|nr:chorismate synthase [Oscillospiraceae bacterium]
MNTFGERYRVTVFGESHGAAIGCVIDGLPPGYEIDLDAVRADLARRAPGNSPTATARRETDNFTVVSGLLNGRTTGAALTAYARNSDTRSHDYSADVPRPGHSDYPASVKYFGFNDRRGGGIFSGRLTAPLVFAGAIAKQILRGKFGAEITARALSIAGETDEAAQTENILAAKAAGDSVGGVIECAAAGLPPGLGEPLYGSIESQIAALVFAVPAVKGIEFGDGFGFAARRGSEVSDGMAFGASGEVEFLANHNGGILGGITTGQPLIFRAAIKPTPTIALPQRTVNLADKTSVTHSFAGRHDPCIVLRAIPVIEAVCAIALMQFDLTKPI